MSDNIIGKGVVNKKVKKQKIKKRSLDEFKNWLEGFTEFQEDDWSPTPDQWEYIKNSIYAIVEPSQQEHVPVQPPVPVRSTPNFVQPQISQVPQHIASGLENNNPVQLNDGDDEYKPEFV